MEWSLHQGGRREGPTMLRVWSGEVFYAPHSDVLVFGLTVCDTQILEFGDKYHPTGL